jgi:hypothetical protein
MLLIYCMDPLARGQPDANFAGEVSAAEALGLPHALINFETLVHDSDPARAVRAVPTASQPDLGVLRGWMLRPEQYAQLYTALLERNVRLINDPAAYQHCHYLPESYASIAAWAPPTVWLPLAPDAEPPTRDTLRTLLAPFGNRPLIVKDYVKSRKHEWLEACFIPSAADLDGVDHVVRRFLELQADDLAVGLVFREYVTFTPLTTHARSGMPLTREYRIFWLDGEPVLTAPYWEEGDYAGDEPATDAFRPVAAAIASRFFTMDVAQRADDSAWQIVELGDGQVAGIPERADVAHFCQALAQHLS